MTSSTRPASLSHILAAVALDVAWRPKTAIADDDAAVAKVYCETGVRHFDRGTHDPVARNASVNALCNNAKLTSIEPLAGFPSQEKIGRAA